MKTKQLPFLRNKFFKSFENGSKDRSFLHYAYLVGLFEGDGFFSISKNGKYLTYEVGIELSIRDVQLISKIKKVY